jgi:5'-nucleotidase
LADTDQFNVVTNSFTAGGRDGYVTFGAVSRDGRAVDTYLDYAQSFVDYVKEQGSISKPAAEDYSTQSYTPPAQ